MKKLVLLVIFCCVIFGQDIYIGKLASVPFTEENLNNSDSLANWEITLNIPLNNYSCFLDVTEINGQKWYKQLYRSYTDANQIMYPTKFFINLLTGEKIVYHKNSAIFCHDPEIMGNYILDPNINVFSHQCAISVLTKENQIVRYEYGGTGPQIVYVCGKITDKYLALVNNDISNIETLEYNFIKISESGNFEIDSTPITFSEQMNIEIIKKSGSDSIYYYTDYKTNTLNKCQFEDGKFTKIGKVLSFRPKKWKIDSDGLKYLYNNEYVHLNSKHELLKKEVNTYSSNENFTHILKIENDSLKVFDTFLNKMVNAWENSSINYFNIEFTDAPFIDSENIYFNQITFYSDVKNQLNDIPSTFHVTNYPNPFNPETTIEYNLPEPGNVKVEIYNLLGQKIKTLEKGEKKAGTHKVKFSAGNLSSGTYLCRIIHQNKSITKKLILIK